MKRIIRTNSLRAWVLAARPKTLTGAAVPVIVGTAMALTDLNTDYGLPVSLSFNIFPALLCLLFAFIMQISANFINDYFDYLNGYDRDDRLGPPRACAQGFVTIDVMKYVISGTTILGCIVGLPLIIFGGLEIISVGVLSVAAAFLYTTHLSRKGFGDLLVLLFFGIIPVCTCYYIQLHTLTVAVVLVGFAVGFVIDTLLMVNNIRDYKQDKKSGKKTIVVRTSKRFGQRCYLALGLLGTLLCFPLAFMGYVWGALLSLLYLIWHISTWMMMMNIDHGVALNYVLGRTSRNIALFGLLLTIGVVLSNFAFGTNLFLSIR